MLIRSIKRIAAARQAWTRCMHAAGYNYLDDQGAIIADFQQRLEKLLGGEDLTKLTGDKAVALQKVQRQ